jgi:hypothetical protein
MVRYRAARRQWGTYTSTGTAVSAFAINIVNGVHIQRNRDFLYDSMEGLFVESVAIGGNCFSKAAAHL